MGIKQNKETAWRSIFKAITWRLIASLTTFLLAMLFFQDDPLAIEKASGVAGAEMIVKIVLYYLHERAWINIHWGLLQWRRKKLNNERAGK